MRKDQLPIAPNTTTLFHAMKYCADGYSSLVLSHDVSVETPQKVLENLCVKKAEFKHMDFTYFWSDKCVSLFAVLTVGQGTRDFQSKFFVVYPQHHRAVANFH
jgi:hypothetical protein